MKNIIKEEIEKLYHENLLSISEIAKLYNTNYSAIYREFKKLGINKRKRGNIDGKVYTKKEPYNKQQLTEEQKCEIEKMYINNIPCKEIYTKLGNNEIKDDKKSFGAAN